MAKTGHIFGYVRPHLPFFAGAFVLMLASAGCEALVTLLIKPIFDNILFFAPTAGRIELFKWPFSDSQIYLDQINPFPFNAVWLVIGLLIVAGTVVKGLTEYSSSFMLNYVGQSVVMNIRNDLYRRILSHSSSFLHTHSTGRLISRVTNDIEKIQFASSTVLADALKQGLTLVVFLYIIFSVDWALASVSLLIAPLVVYPSRVFGRKIRQSSHSSQDKMSEISELLQETITGHRVVKSFGMENFELGKFKQATRRLAKINLSWIRIHSMASPFMEVLGAVTLTLMLFYAQTAIRSGRMTAGDFAVFLFAFIKMYEPVRRISGIYSSFQQASGATSKVFELMNEPIEVTEKPGAIHVSSLKNSIEFQQVSFNYNDSRLPVLRDINLKVKPGEVIALVGASGSGKTTMVNLLPRFFDVTDGKILIDQIDIRDITLESLRSLIGLVGQETILFNDTVRNNICYGRQQVSVEEMITAAEAALVDDFIGQLPNGYDSVIGEKGQKLSGGQRQRIAIARAILKDSPILILDEATSALDSESEVLVQKALSNLMQGRTVFVIAHRLATIRRADRIVVLDQGRICEIGTHNELMSRGGIYHRLYELQFADTDAAWVS
ncbi:MAG: ABC transporter ATP-binding protein [Acidobacteriota bacterium]